MIPIVMKRVVYNQAFTRPMLPLRYVGTLLVELKIERFKRN